MNTRICVAVLVSVVVLGASSARAADLKGFGELVAGFAAPVGDGDYTDTVTPSVKLGLRAGYLPNLGKRRLRIGFELAADYTPYSDDFPDTGTEQFTFFRIRGLLGARAIYEHKPGWFVIGRALAGVDMFSTDVKGVATGVEYVDSDVDVGVALELSGGLLVNVGEVALGAQLGFPIGLQADDGAADVSAFDAAFVSVDVDLLFTVAFAL